MTVVRHSAATRAEAARLREAGWTLHGISRVLTRRGTPVHESTILYWTSDKATEKRRRNDRERHAVRNAERSSFRWPGRPRTEAWLIGRMRVLQAAGLSVNAITKVIAVDHGLEFSQEQVRYALQAGRSRAIRKAAS